MSNREAFLARVRQAAEQGRQYRVHVQDVPADIGYVGAGGDLVQRFCEEVTAVGGQVFGVNTVERARDKLRELLVEAKAGSAVCWQHELLKRVGLDPVIAALLGTGSIIQGFYRETTLPSYNGALTGKYKLFSVQVSASRSVTPGNGVYLASASENYQAGYSYTGLRKASFGVSGGYSKLGSIGQSLSGYGQYTGGVNGNYNVMKYVSITARYDYRQSIIDLVGYNRKANRFTLGFTFSPAEIPFSWIRRSSPLVSKGMLISKATSERCPQCVRANPTSRS